MFRAPRILCMAGSSRKGSVNVQLMQVAARILREKGAEVSVLDLAQFDLPIFSQDIETQGPPKGLKEMKASMAQADGLLVASPEYNGSMSPLLVNSISWLSRSAEPNEAMYASFTGKVATVVAASPGGLGGLRGLTHIRELLTNLGTTVLPEQVAIGGAFKAFDGDKLVNEAQSGMLNAALSSLFEEARSRANKEAVCKIAQKMQGDYGEIILP